MHRGVVEPDRVRTVARQRIAIAAGVAEGSARVEQAGQTRRRIAADRVGETQMSGMAQRQRQPGAACQRGGSAAGTQDHPPVLRARPACANLDVAGGGGADRQDLIEHDPLAQRSAKGLDARPRTDHATVLIEHGGLLPRRQQRQALGHLGGVDLARAHPGAAHRLQPSQPGRPERHHAVAREQLAAELFLPFAPPAACLDRELDQPAVVVSVAEDPRLPAGLPIARGPSLVDGHGGAQLGQRVRRREPDDPGPDHPYVGVSAHAASRGIARSLARLAPATATPPPRG